MLFVGTLENPGLPVQYGPVANVTAVTDSTPNVYAPEASFARASVAYAYERNGVGGMAGKPASNKIPEPHRWATLLTGFGLVILALRRRINR